MNLTLRLPETSLAFIFTFLFILCCGHTTSAQSVKPTQKQLQALRINTSLKIDGVLDEAIWQEAPVAGNFIEHKPTPGRAEKHPTEVRVLYDDVAIYIGAVMHDVSQDSIFRELSKRDNLGNTDFFGVFFDTYNDQINGFGFVVTPAGVQFDARYSSNGEDESWNAVWESSASLQGNNWVAELMIPFSALRFSSKPEQLWGVNFFRQRRSTRQEFFWNNVDPATDGFVNQWGKLTGIQDVEAPLRLALIPYVSGYAEQYPVQNGNGGVSYSENVNFSGGMDVKYGINDAFTLDMTLIPDFSQVQSDNQVLNLSPFEVQFNENRPFFMEGTELFNKGGFFYSRRIGGAPINYSNFSTERENGYRVIENPRETRMLNGTKISGRTQSGLGIGLFNAVVGRTFATLEDEEGNRSRVETQPLTNYNIAVFDQSLKNNSFVTLVNTNVMRGGSTYDANLTGLLFRIANKGNRYAVSGRGALSQKYMSGDADLGHTYELGFGKVSGNFQYSVSHLVMSDTYDPNDLGILFTNNTNEQSAVLRYNIYQPFWKLLNLNSSVGAAYARRYEPDVFQNFYMFSNLSGTFKNFTSTGISLNLEPVLTYDFFEPRAAGRFYTFPTNFSLRNWISTDYRKKFALDINWAYRHFNENERRNFDYSISPRYRVNNQLTFVYGYSRNSRHDDMGFATSLEEQSISTGKRKILFGLRDVNTTTNTLTGSYIFNNRMSLSLRARHYWSKAEYKRFYDLGTDGTLALDTYPNGYNSRYENRDHNINYNAFNIDMVYSWWFAPGSEISVVWKNAVLESGREIVPTYFENVSKTVSAPQTNSLSIKVLYYIDYQILKSKFSKS